MSLIAGFLQIEDPINGCGVLLDNWMTKELSKESDDCRWRIETECPECACETASCGVTTLEDAPWYDPNQPGSLEFFGLYGQLSISQPGASTNYTATGATIAAPLKQLTFVGAIIACTARGATFGRQWVAKQLEPLCTSCDGRQATINLWCPDALCDNPEPVEPDTTDTGVPVIEVDWASIPGVDGCTPAAPLGPTPDPADPYDTGGRNLIDVDYVPGSFADLDDSIPTCFGSRVTFSFVIKNGDLFLPAAESCLLKPPTTSPQPCCAPLVWQMTDPVEPCGCPVECDCTTDIAESTVDAGMGSVLADGAAACNYSTPLCAKTYACLTSTFSTSHAVPTITITTGLNELRNVSVTIWEARHGLPNPSTAEGFQVYQQLDPIVDPALIGYIPPQASLTIDGRSEKEWIVCPGGTNGPQQSSVTRCGNRRYRHPTLCCGRRYWVALEVECLDDHTPVDWQMVTELAGVERV